ncbi:hypothetical protein LQW54_001573 [Pestalotiopsis sp. IQ-011]
MISHKELEQACTEQSQRAAALAWLWSQRLQNDDRGLDDGQPPQYEDGDGDQTPAASGRRLVILNPAHFPTIAPVLEDPEAYYDEQYHVGIAIVLPCPLCGRQLALDDAVMPDDNDDNDGEEEVEVEDMAVLPCGHMIGADCLAQHLAAYQFGSCPVCEFPLGHESCGHAVGIRVYGRDPIPEGDSEVNGECRACRLEVRGLVRDMLGDVVAALGATDLAPARVAQMERELLDITMERLRPRLDRHNLEW